MDEHGLIMPQEFAKCECRTNAKQSNFKIQHTSKLEIENKKTIDLFSK